MAKKEMKTFKKVNTNMIDGGIVPVEYSKLIKQIAENHDLEVKHKTSVKTFLKGKSIVCSIVKAKGAESKLALLWNWMTPEDLKGIKGLTVFGKFQTCREPYSTFASFRLTKELPSGFDKMMKQGIKVAESAYEINASSSSSGGTITEYVWDFGDDTTGSGKIVEHKYTKAGTFTVTLTITDSNGKTDNATQTITIK